MKLHGTVYKQNIMRGSNSNQTQPEIYQVTRLANKWKDTYTYVKKLRKSAWYYNPFAFKTPFLLKRKDSLKRFISKMTDEKLILLE